MSSSNLYPSRLRAGERTAALSSLASRSEMLGRSRRNLNLYDPFPRVSQRNQSLHPVYQEVRSLLSERLIFESDFDSERATCLLNSDPAFFNEGDFNLVVRAIWKGDRVGFYKGGNEVFRNGFLSALIKNWDNPLKSSAD